jgi:hypothetical protein
VGNVQSATQKCELPVAESIVIPMLLDMNILCFKGQRTVIRYLLLQCDLKQVSQTRGEVRRSGQLYPSATLPSSD